ncbi:hypothetical protein JOD45_002858 [Scopulibacillus daqui]|uniref:DUF3139 domain-containing protein n=1 Tax=Scopulibacillus daqui TaxID=1469162 RepID=A0ABS2Q3C9_9BACL|nr:DUF3139 domain-containing protein [Scopulibacillus daqui]MBM7646626.1 hypothetical protein [Scopulibacillus daqui]
MKKSLKVIGLLILVILAIRGIYLSYDRFIYGNPKEITASENKMDHYLIKKGYKEDDIACIKGVYNYLAAGDQKYGGKVKFVSSPKKEYEYVIKDGKILELDKIPNPK